MPNRAASGERSIPIPAQVGIGMRAEHEQATLDTRPDIGWLEVHSENYFGTGGRPATQLLRLREHYPISLHGIGLGLGNTVPLDRPHLQRLKHLIGAIEPSLVSEHLCWNAHGERYFSDLLPLPHTREAATHVAARIDAAQQAVGRQILIENVSSYIQFEHADMSEWEFLLEVTRQSGCGILLDVNNVYVNACNHDYDAREFLDAVPCDAIGEIHVAGHARRSINAQALLIDTHDRPVCDQVWQLYAQLIARVGAKPTLLERDANLPPLDDLVEEAKIAERLLHEHAGAGAGA